MIPCFDPASAPTEEETGPEGGMVCNRVESHESSLTEEFSAQALEAGSLGSDPDPALGLRQVTSPLSASAPPSIKWMLTYL